MLYLVGAGLRDEGDITVRGMEILESCDSIYLESYTSPWKGLQGLEERGIEVEEIERSEMEEEAGELIDEAATSDVAVLVPGDPLVATTHLSVFLDAREAGVSTRVIHAPSIYSAIASTGLSIYKFGKTTTIPRPRQGYEPTSFYDTITDNLRMDAHTLCLLDVHGGPMSLRRGVEILEEIEEEEGRGIIREGKELVAASFGGDSTVVCGGPGELKETQFPKPAALVVPTDLNNMEERALEEFRI